MTKRVPVIERCAYRDCARLDIATRTDTATGACIAYCAVHELAARRIFGSRTDGHHPITLGGGRTQ